MQRPPASAASVARPQLLFAGVPALVAAVILAGTIFIPRLWLPPMQLLLDFADLQPGAAVSIASGADGPQLNVSVRPLPTPYTLTVTATGERNTASGGTDVYFLPPVQTHTPAGDGAPSSMEPGWVPWAHGGRWYATPEPQRSTKLVWQDHALGAVTLPIIAHPSGGIARYELDGGAAVTVDHYAAADEWREVRLPLERGAARLVAALPMRDTAIHAAVGDPPATLTRARVVWGEHVLADWRGTMRLEAAPAMLPVRARGPGVVARLAIGGGLLLLGRAALQLLLAAVLGLPVVLALLPALDYLERWLALLAVGLSIPIVATTTLTRLDVDGDRAFWITLVLGIAAAAVALLVERRRGGDRLRALIPARGEPGPLLSIMALGAIATLLIFAPAMAYPHWFTGHALTDSYFYINHAEAFRHESINRLQQPDWRAHANIEHLVAGIYNWAERTGDLLVLLNTALLYGEATRAAYTQLHFNYWLLLPLIGYCLLRRARPAGAAVWVGTVLLTCSAMLYSVFTQCYVAQYVSVFFVLITMWATALADAQLRAAPGAPSNVVILLALPLAATVCVFPAQFVMPAVVAAVMLVTALALRSWRPVRSLVLVGGATAVLGAAGLIPLCAAPRDLPRYADRLNEIGRTAVFPFYRDPLIFGQVLYGIRDWVGVSRDSRKILPDVLGTDHPIWPIQRSSHSARNLMLICFAITLIGVARGCRDPAGRTIALTLVVFSASAAALGLGGQMYLGAKMAVTCGVLALPALVLGLDAVFARRGAVLQLVGGGLAGILLFTNVTTAWFESSPWLLPERHVAAAARHMSVLDADLRELVESPLFRKNQRRAGRLAVVGDYAQARGTDRDRVLAGYLSSALAGYWVTANPTPEQWRERRIEQAVVFAGYELPPELASRATLRFENALARVYDLGPR